jgi:hypothetical protein
MTQLTDALAGIATTLDDYPPRFITLRLHYETADGMTDAITALGHTGLSGKYMAATHPRYVARFDVDGVEVTAYGPTP